MSLKLHGMSGSPYTWKVALALEHKQLAYEMRWVSPDAGDLKQPEFLALNPRGLVPVLTTDDLSLYESEAILRHLEDAHPTPTLFPGQPATRALAYRMVAEVDAHFSPALEDLVREVLFKPDPTTRDPQKIENGIARLGRELAHFERELRGDFLVGSVSAADFSLYPSLTLALRIEQRDPSVTIASLIGPRLLTWKARIEALPYYDRTYPPHWKRA